MVMLKKIDCELSSVFFSDLDSPAVAESHVKVCSGRYAVRTAYATGSRTRLRMAVDRLRYGLLPMFRHTEVIVNPCLVVFYVMYCACVHMLEGSLYAWPRS